MPCVYVPGNDGGLAGMLDYVDCQAQTIGSQGYLALAAPGSPANLALTGLITILVAFYGYRLLFGQVPGVRDGVLVLVKIGIVVALATGWTGYRTLFYDLVLHGPTEITSLVGGASGLPGATGGLVAHIDGTDRLFQALMAVDAQEPLTAPPRPDLAPAPFASFNIVALGSARVVFITGAVGAFAAVRLTAGLLLALGPLFIAFLLFEATRGLFIGWLRVLAGAALGAIATAITLGVELALLEPWLVDLVARRSGDEAIPGAPAQLLAATLVFATALLALIIAVGKVAWSLDVSRRGLFQVAGGSVSRSDRVEADRMESYIAPGRSIERARAAAVADAVAATERREITGAAGAGAIHGRGVLVPASMTPAGAPIGTGRTASATMTGGRRTSGRISASAGRRDTVR